MAFKNQAKKFMLTPEQQFVLVGSRYSPNHDDILLAKDLFPKVKDWEAVIQMSMQHGVASILLHNAINHYKFSLPAPVQQKFQQIYYSNLSSYHQRRKRFVEVVKVLNNVGIVPVLFKGLAFAEYYYTDPAHRPMGDFDFYIERAAILNVEEVLLSLNLERTIGKVKEVTRWGYDHHLIPFYDTESGLLIEPHWEFFAERFDFPFDSLAVAARAKEIELDGAKVRLPCTKDLLSIQYLTIKKGLIEGGNRLSRFNDIRCIYKSMSEPQNPGCFEAEHAAYLFLSTSNVHQPETNAALWPYLYSVFYPQETNPFRVILHNALFNSSLKKNLTTFRILIFPPLGYLQQKYKVKTKIIALLLYLAQPVIALFKLGKLFRS